MNNDDDPYKVWEIKVLKGKPLQEEATKMLEKIAKQVQPIMRKHKWSVKLLSEFCQERYLGYNFGDGRVKLRLRRHSDFDFYPFDEVLDTMLHELCHYAHGPHNAQFYKLWNQLRKECAVLRSKGITGSGRQLGGDSVIMKALTPVQAAAMAAERRLQDDIWCGSQSCEASDHAENIKHKGKNVGTSRLLDNSSLPLDPKSRKRSRVIIDLTTDTPQVESIIEQRTATQSEELAMWKCSMCTLLNKTLAQLCELCGTQQPKDFATKYSAWSCRFCTLENSVKLDKCLACDQWRYSLGT